MSFHRGEVRSYAPVLPRKGQSLVRVIMSADAFNATSAPIVYSVHVVDTDPGNLLSVELAGHGFALATTLEGTMKSRLGDVQGTISLDEREAIERALRALLDLD
ncbi:hypothetical protein WIS52_04215 [Pseudonocardia nematodicida]|uniref:mRNA interferase MazF n=1 Tax=Pseudonocardia nematodicida TaxID=1206997 RepID=A0ABV1K5E0_9PSEU